MFPLKNIWVCVLIRLVMHWSSEIYINRCYSGVVNWGILALDFRACLGLVLGCITWHLLWLCLKRRISLRVLQKLLHLLLDMRRFNRRIQQPDIILSLPWWRVEILSHDLGLRLQIPEKRIRLIRSRATNLGVTSIFNWGGVLVLVPADRRVVVQFLLPLNGWVSFLFKVVLVPN